VGCTHHTQAEHGPVSFTGPSTSVSCQRPRSCEPSARTARFGDSAQASAKRSLQKRSERIHFGRSGSLEPGPASFGGSDASVTPRCRCHLTSRPLGRQNLLSTWPVSPAGFRPKQKRPSRGSP